MTTHCMALSFQLAVHLSKAGSHSRLTFVSQKLVSNFLLVWGFLYACVWFGWFFFNYYFFPRISSGHLIYQICSPFSVHHFVSQSWGGGGGEGRDAKKLENII